MRTGGTVSPEEIRAAIATSKADIQSEEIAEAARAFSSKVGEFDAAAAAKLG